MLPSIAAARTEAALWLPFALAGALAVVNAALIAELSTALPRSGGSYGWIRRSLGPLAATVVGLANWPGTAVATAFYCVGFGIYVGLFVQLPEGWPFGFLLAPERSGALFAAFAILAANYLGAIAVVSIAGTVILLSAVDAGVLLGTVGFVGIAVGWHVVYGRDRGKTREPLEEFLRRRAESVAGESGSPSDRGEGPAGENLRRNAGGGGSTVDGDGAIAPASAERIGDRPGETVLLPLSNPRTERNLVELGCAVARARGANVVAIHVVQVP